MRILGSVFEVLPAECGYPTHNNKLPHSNKQATTAIYLTNKFHDIAYNELDGLWWSLQQAQQLLNKVHTT